MEKYDVIVTHADPDTAYASARIIESLGKLSDSEFCLLNFQGFHTWDIALVSRKYFENLSEEDEEELCSFLSSTSIVLRNSGDVYIWNSAVICFPSWDADEANIHGGTTQEEEG